MFFKKKAAGADWLIVGLGNPGKKYEGTRHNAGFDALDYMAAQWGTKITKAKFEGLYGQAAAGGQKLVLLKPQTFMNLSGRSIQAAADYFKIPVEHIIVLCDDVTQSPGKLRIRPSGSAGGHNGLKDIIARFGSENFARIRIGVGEKPHPDYDLANWVMGKLTGAERKAFESRYDDILQAAVLITQGELAKAQNRCNG